MEGSTVKDNHDVSRALIATLLKYGYEVSLRHYSYNITGSLLTNFFIKKDGFNTQHTLLKRYASF